FVGNSGTAYRSVMAYGSADRKTHSFFSNPNIIYDGKPTGVPTTAANSADNAQTLNRSALLVSQFRAGGSTTAETIAPVVTLTSPTAGAILTTGTINFSANATDNAGVARVEFYL